MEVRLMDSCHKLFNMWRGAAKEATCWWTEIRSLSLVWEHCELYTSRNEIWNRSLGPIGDVLWWKKWRHSFNCYHFLALWCETTRLCVAVGFRFGCQATYSFGFLALVQVLRIPYGEIQVWGIWNFWSLRFISGSDCPWAGRGLGYLRGESLQLSPFCYPTPKTFLIHTLLIP